MNSRDAKAILVATTLGFSLAITAFMAPVQADNHSRSKRDRVKVVNPSDSNKATEEKEAQPVLPSGINLSDIDNSVSPRNDFFNYAIGNWRKLNPIPDDQARWSSFNILHENNTLILRDILENAAQNPTSNLERKLGNFYTSGMDQTSIDRAGLAPINAELQAIAKIRSSADVQQVILLLNNQGLNPYFSFGSGQDDKKSSRVIGTFWQGGIGLPERDYYFRQDESSVALRAKYKEYMTHMFELLGDTPGEAQEAMQRAYGIEEKLAQASLPAAEMRDPEKVYNLLTYKELGQLAPNIQWKLYFKGHGIALPKDVNVTVPDSLKAVSDMLEEQAPAQAHRDYLRWYLLNQQAPYLASQFEQAHFGFYSTTLTGVSSMKPRWKRVISVINGAMGQGLGQIYVKEHFSPDAKAHVLGMVDNIKQAMAKSIKSLSWMSPATKEAALIKLNKFQAKIGYPDHPRDYSKLLISSHRYYDNVRNSGTFNFKRDMKKIGRPVDRTEWHMTPQTVNAYYNPGCNEIVFPAGILQPPFFDPKVDDAVNYGGIGMVIGHEISHGFDDQGAQYDGDGNLRNWWSKQDINAFNKLAKGVEDQFSNYDINGQKLNGKLVLGESIADLCGLSLAWNAYQSSTAGKEPQTIDGFTPAQRFFLGYAKVWATNVRPEYLRQQINTDPHPPAYWRVNGPLSNMELFYEAFDVQEGDPMRRPADQHNKIW